MINLNGTPIREHQIETLWPAIRRFILDCAGIANLHISGADLVLAKKTFTDWVKAPGYSLDNPGHAFVKDLDDDLGELAWMLLANVRAAANRRQEEVLAWLVIGNLRAYEAGVLNPLLRAITRISAANEGLRASPTAYGPLVTASRWDGTKWSVSDFAGENHEVLYAKVGFIHSFALSYIKLNRIVIPGRRQSEEMRKPHSKGSLNEYNPAVYRDRLAGVSVWAGTSGSTMDVIYFAKHVVGMTDVLDLTCLAWCMFAFFHIMPTGISPTHTFHEVMRAAKTVEPNLFYNPANTTLPATDPVTTVQDLIARLRLNQLGRLPSNL